MGEERRLKFNDPTVTVYIFIPPFPAEMGNSFAIPVSLYTLVAKTKANDGRSWKDFYARDPEKTVQVSGLNELLSKLLLLVLQFQQYYLRI